MSCHLRHHLPHGRTGPAVARRLLDVLRGVLSPEDLGELRLLVSELVTNAVRHGLPAAGAGGVELTIDVNRERTRVEVVDGGAGFVPPAGPLDADRPGGWGLVVVDELASRWGVETNGKTLVWLEFDGPSAVRHMAGSHS